MNSSVKLLQVDSIFPKVVRYKENLLGRDFVVGDVHGSFDRVWSEMKKAKFDREHDRLFCLGDLIDRGQGSSRCLAFLNEPYVHSIRGNHEQTLVEIYKSQEGADDVVSALAGINYNGMKWLSKVSKKDRLSMAKRFSELPLVIEIEGKRGLIGLIHGEVPIGMSWGKFLERIQAGDTKVTESCLEGRERINMGCQEPVQGVGRIFVGHTTLREGVGKYGNVYGIDTGSVLQELTGKDIGMLTLANVNCKTDALLRAGDEGRFDAYRGMFGTSMVS